MKFILLISLLTFSCALNNSKVTKMPDGNYKVTCSGNTDDKCQKKAWNVCNGPFDTIKDELTGTRTVGQYNSKINDYEYIFKCATE